MPDRERPQLLRILTRTRRFFGVDTRCIRCAGFPIRRDALKRVCVRSDFLCTCTSRLCLCGEFVR